MQSQYTHLGPEPASRARNVTARCFVTGLNCDRAMSASHGAAHALLEAAQRQAVAHRERVGGGKVTEPSVVAGRGGEEA